VPPSIAYISHSFSLCLATPFAFFFRFLQIVRPLVILLPFLLLGNGPSSLFDTAGNRLDPVPRYCCALSLVYLSLLELFSPFDFSLGSFLLLPSTTKIFYSYRSLRSVSPSSVLDFTHLAPLDQRAEKVMRSLVPSIVRAPHGLKLWAGCPSFGQVSPLEAHLFFLSKKNLGLRHRKISPLDSERLID